MNTVQPCYDTSDVEALCKHRGLYLKPIAKLHISVQLPPLRINGKSISNWEIMEKVKNVSKPDEFVYMKVGKSSLEFVRFEAELESRHQIKPVLTKLDGRTIKLSGFTDLLKIRACEAKSTSPTKHDWDSFFRDAKNMNEMKPGERPDTVHIEQLPSHWFSSSIKKSSTLPDETVVREIFETFGPVRCLDIPVLDQYRPRISSTLHHKTQSFDFRQEAHFETFIQYKEYMGFVKCMMALKGMKLLFKDEDKAWTASIQVTLIFVFDNSVISEIISSSRFKLIEILVLQVDFDKTKHLSEANIKKRKMIREKLIEEDIAQERERKRRKELEALKHEAERRKAEEELAQQQLEEARKEREKKKKRKEARKKKHEKKLEKSIALEERKLLITQRKLESLRLLDFLLERVKVDFQREEAKKKEEDLLKELEKMQQKKAKRERKQAEKEKRKQQSLEEKEKEIRSRLVQKYKRLEERRMEEQRENLRRAMERSSVRLKSVVAPAHVSGEFSGCSTATDDITLSDEPDKEIRNDVRAATSYPRTKDYSSQSRCGNGFHRTRPSPDRWEPYRRDHHRADVRPCRNPANRFHSA